MSDTELRKRIVDALTEPDTLRCVNAGALEEELWTDEEWRDEYADDLQAELDAMAAERLLGTVEVYGTTSYHLLPKP